MDHITHLLRCEYWAKIVSKCNNRGMRKIDSEKGAEASAVTYSIVEIAEILVNKTVDLASNLWYVYFT